MESYYGKKIREYRISKGLTQEELAKKLNISTSFLRMIELGQRKPNQQLQEEILKLSGISYFDEIISQIDNEIQLVSIMHLNV